MKSYLNTSTNLKTAFFPMRLHNFATCIRQVNFIDSFDSQTFLHLKISFNSIFAHYSVVFARNFCNFFVNISFFFSLIKITQIYLHTIISLNEMITIVTPIRFLIADFTAVTQIFTQNFTIKFITVVIQCRCNAIFL